MTPFQTLSLKYAGAGFATVSCVLCLIAALQFSMPRVMPPLMPFSESYYAHAATAPDSDTRLKLAEQTVGAASNRAENWLLLASARQQKDEALSGRVLSALRTSYKVAPLSPDAHEWRLDYLFSNWRLIPADLKTNAMKEAEAYFTRYAGQIYIRQLARTATDKDGRAALALIVLTHDRAVESARRVAEYRATHDVENNPDAKSP